MTDEPADVADDENSARHPREVFLTELWQLLVSEDARAGGQPSWLESWSRGTARGTTPDNPTAAALHRVLAAGADPDDLTDVVRTMQYEVIYNVCQLLDDPSLLGVQLEPGEDTAGSGVGWQLFATGGGDSSRRSPIGELHSSLDEYDPSGRRGAPRGRPIPAVLPGQPLYARLAVAQYRTGDRIGAIQTWRHATGETTAEAKAGIESLLDT